MIASQGRPPTRATHRLGKEQSWEVGGDRGFSGETNSTLEYTRGGESGSASPGRANLAEEEQMRCPMASGEMGGKASVFCFHSEG